MNSIKVFGHKSPDTDTVCSAILFAWYYKEVKHTDATPYKLGELNKETKFVLQKFGFETPETLKELTEEDTVAIVDTSNPGELPETLNKATILEIVDHHKLAGLVTDVPLTMNIRPSSCTASIIYDLTNGQDIQMPNNMKQLVLSCIISDTLMFRSPTTTTKEKEYANQLATELDIDIQLLATEMFDNKSDLTGMTAIDLLNTDSKMFELKGKQVKVSVLETTKPQNTIDMKDDVKIAIDTLKESRDIDEVFFFAIDILNGEATCIISSDVTKNWIENAFNVQVTSDTVVIPNIISRKKQIIPKLSK